MSVLVKGIEMPKNCFSCPFEQFDFCAVQNKEIRGSVGEKERDNNCPLAAVPPHGRLIDADALIAAHKDVCSRSMKFNLDLAPTIIEADKADMDSFIRIFEEDDEENGMDSFIQILKD